MEEPLDYRSRLVGDTLRCQAWVILLSVLVGIGLGYAASVARPGSYVASATVLITPLAGNPYSPGVTGQDSLVSIETESKVASSDSVSARVAAALLKDGGTRVDLPTLEKGVSVSVPPSTQIIEITYASKDPKFAQQAATQYVAQYLDSRIAAAEAINNAQLASLRRQLNSVTQALAEAKLSNSPALVRTLGTQSASLKSQIQTLSSNEPDPGHEISPATTPVKTSGLGRNLYLMAGALLGLGVGLALALARQRRDDRVYHAEEIDAVGIPVMASLDETPEQSAEAVRLIRARALTISSTPAVVVVGPPSLGHESLPVAERLAESLARVGRQVVFVDLVGESAQAEDGGAPLGFTDLLTGQRSSIRKLLVESSPQVTVLPRGRAELGDAVEFLDTDRLRGLLADLPAQTDAVVVGAPTLTDSVGETLMKTADLTVVTATLGRSTRAELHLLRARAEDRIGACLTPRAKRRLRLTPWRSRKEGSQQVSSTGEALKIVDDEEKSA